jgi:hypothetical protein
MGSAELLGVAGRRTMNTAAASADGWPHRLALALANKMVGIC